MVSSSSRVRSCAARSLQSRAAQVPPRSDGFGNRHVDVVEDGEGAEQGVDLEGTADSTLDAPLLRQPSDFMAVEEDRAEARLNAAGRSG